MELSVAERTFLEILSDGRKKTYVHIARGFGMPLSPMAPTFTNKIAKRLLKLGLIEAKGRLAPGYRITQTGLGALHQRPTVVRYQPPPPPPTGRRYPTAAFVLSLIAGIMEFTINSIAFLYYLEDYGGATSESLWLAICALFMIVGAVKLRSNPGKHVRWGVFIVVVSVIGLYRTLGGFFIGFLLGVAGGILGIGWRPKKAAPPLIRTCPNCRMTLTPGVKFCPHCGTRLSTS